MFIGSKFQLRESGILIMTTLERDLTMNCFNFFLLNNNTRNEQWRGMRIERGVSEMKSLNDVTDVDSELNVFEFCF